MKKNQDLNEQVHLLEQEVRTLSLVIPSAISIIVKVLDDIDPDNIGTQYLIDIFQRTGFDYLRFRERCREVENAGDLARENLPNLLAIAYNFVEAAPENK